MPFCGVPLCGCIALTQAQDADGHVTQTVTSHRLCHVTPAIPLEEDELNLTGQAWTQIAFHIQAIAPQDDGWTGFRHAEIRATSADGLHHIRLRFCRMPVDGPYLFVNIRYSGPQHFRTFDTCDYLSSRGGTLQEYRRQTLYNGPLGLDDPRVFEN
jgi:hypothetical protein